MKSVRGKLLFGFILILLFMVGQSVLTYIYFDRNRTLVQQAISQDFKAAMDLSKVAVAGQKIRRYEKEYFIYVDNLRKRAGYSEEFNETHAKLEQLLETMVTDFSGTWSDQDRLEIRRWQQALLAYGQGFRSVVDKVETAQITDTVGANVAIQDAKNKFRVLLKGTAKMIPERFRDASQRTQQIAANSQIVKMVVVGTSTAGISLVLLLMLAIPGSIAKPIRKLSEAARRMSTGDLDETVPQSRVREFSELAQTLERMRVSQKAMIDRIMKPA